jgi:putative transposase
MYYRDEGLSLRRHRRKKAAAVPRVALPKPTQPGHWYAMDFVHDRLANGRRFKCLTMTDLCSKEVPVIEVDVFNGGVRVCRILDRLFTTRPLPDALILDNVIYAESEHAVRTNLLRAVVTATLHDSANIPNGLPRAVRRCSP